MQLIYSSFFVTTFPMKKYKGKISCGEVGIPITNNDLILPCGIYGRWEENE